MESINNLLTDANSAHKRQLDEGRQLTSKWENTGLLEGIGNEYEKVRHGNSSRKSSTSVN